MSNLLKHIVNVVRAALRESLRRRFSMRLTIEGWCLVATMMLIGLAALSTAAPLLYLMFSMMCSFFVLSALMANSSIRHLDVSREMPRVWQAQTPLRVALKIRNRKPFLTSYSLRVQDVLSDGRVLGGAYFDAVEPRGRDASQEYETIFLHRGEFRLVGIRVSTRFPFGLIERHLFYDAPGDLLVLPQRISLESVLERAKSDLGEHQSSARGHGAGLYGLRAYELGMSARDIHWKLSAKRGDLVIREYEAEERRRAAVVLDNVVAEDQRELARDRFEKAIVLANSAIQWLTDNKHEVELRTASGVIGYGTGPAHVTRCRRTLARLEMVGTEHGNRALLVAGADGAVVFPILLEGREPASQGRFPLSVDEFDRPLKTAFEAKDHLWEEEAGARPAASDAGAPATAS